MSTPAEPSPDSALDKPPRTRRWIPISIWICLAIFSTTGSWTAIRAHRQQGAIREIERVKGTILLTRPRGPVWLRGIIGDGWTKFLLDDVVSVNLADSEVTDSTLVYLQGLPSLERLWLNRSAVTDAGLVKLAGMTDLKELGLQGTRMTDAGLAHLTGLSRLEILFVSQTALTDAGLPYIEKLPRLQKLSIENTQVTDAGLAGLSTMGGLKLLYLGESKATDTGIQKLKAALPSLEIHD